MCTAIAFKGTDVIYGFNMDLDPAVWDYTVIKNKNYFSVGMRVGGTTYLTHGVNRNGCFGNLPYMNGEPCAVPKGAKRQRIDLLVDRYIRGSLGFEKLEALIAERTVVNVPSLSMHSLIGGPNGEMLIVEPGYGREKPQTRYAVLSNFPVLTALDDYANPFYGKDRYDRATAALAERTDLTADEALGILASVRQSGQWGTRVSFVWSKNENRVYYALDGDFSNIRVHTF